VSGARDQHCGCPVCRAPQHLVDAELHLIGRVGRRAPLLRKLVGPALLYVAVYAVVVLVVFR
jgi:hypothetical protein